MAETFYLRPHTLAAIRAENASGSRRAAPDDAEAKHFDAWRRAFPSVEPAIVVGTARRLPATTPEVFARWLAIRSKKSADHEAKEEVLQD